MPRDLISAAALLDSAIAGMAACEFARLTHGLSVGEKARRVSSALDSLHGSIRRLEMPAYAEELVALFYSVWYQPFQVNAAYSLLSRLLAERRHRLNQDGSLDIVDFGSGALAAEIGLALAVADQVSRGIAPCKTQVFLVEPSDAMTRTGFGVWERFMVANGWEVAVDVASWSTTARLGDATISVQRIHTPWSFEAQTGADRWLVAMHAFYAEQQEAIKRDLSDIEGKFGPDLGLFTFHRESEGGVNYVSPFAREGDQAPISPLMMSGAVVRVNRWRRAVADTLGLQDDVRLTRPTEWDPERGLRDNRAILFRRE